MAKIYAIISKLEIKMKAIIKKSISLPVPLIYIFVTILGVTILVQSVNVYAQQQTQSGSTGIEGVIPSDPPTQAATITVPRNGQVFTSIPITVSGLCPRGLLVEVFKNGVFSGSIQCTNGSYSLQIDLFNGQNDIVVRVYDALGQAGPDSNVVTVIFNSPVTVGGNRPTLTTSYAKRGADPGTVLSWPITLSGGRGPYAISVDWGDSSALDLISRSVPGAFNIQHTYEQSGVYNVTIKVTDADGAAAFLQLVAISNGPLQQSTTGVNKVNIKTEEVVIWWPFIVTLSLSAVAFWLGKKHQLQTIRDRLHRGERPI